MTERISRALLKINGRNYPIFDGLNPIGRFQKATVVLKNNTVSQSQAVIVVVNEDLHFISDTYSSNGTFLSNTRLEPLQLYELNDGCAINFGGVYGVYKKVISAGESFNGVESFEESQSFAFGASTQLLESVGLTMQHVEESIVSPTDLVDIHEAETQPAPNIHDLPTQVFEAGVSERITELCPETTDISDVIDLPTQILETTDHLLPNPTVADVDPDATDDECEKREQNEPTVEPLSNNVIEDTVLEASKDEEPALTQTTEASDDSNASLDLMLLTQGVKNQRVASATRNSSNQPVSSPSSTQESALKVGFLKKKASHRLKSDSDSETDVETDAKVNASTDSDTEERLHLSQLRRRTRQLLQSDSEDEDVASVANKSKLNNSSKLDESDIIPSTQQFVDDKPCFSLQNSGGEKTATITSQHSTCSSMENFKLGLTQFAKTSTVSELDCDDLDITVADLQISSNIEVQETVIEETLDESAAGKEAETSDDDVQPAQKTSTDEDCSTQQIVENSEIFQLPTQRMEVENVEGAQARDGEDFLLPAQKVFAGTSGTERSLPKQSSENLENNVYSDRIVIDVPAEKDCTLEDARNEEGNGRTENDLFLMPTQRITMNPIENDEIYDAPTQRICTGGEENDDIHDAPTQKICTNEENRIEEVNNQAENDIFLLPTQRLSTESESIFDAPTQKICTDATESQKFDVGPEEDVFLMPTQHVSATSSDNIFEAPTQKICTDEETRDEDNAAPPQNCDDIESQLEGIFKTQTVRYTESDAGRPSNPLAETFEKIEEIIPQSYATSEETSATKHEEKLEVLPKEVEASSASKQNTERSLRSSKNKLDNKKHEDTKEPASSSVGTESPERNLRSVKHKLENKAVVKNSKKIKLNSDVELESMDSLNQESNDESSTSRKPVVKQTVKSADVSTINEEIKVATFKRTRRTLSKFASAPCNTSEVVAIDKKKTRSCREEEMATPSVSSSPPPTTSKKSARNKAGTAVSRKKTAEFAEPSSESSVEEARSTLKRKTDTTVDVKTPGKRSRTRTMEHTVSDSGCSTDAGSTPRSSRRTVLEVSNTLNTPERARRKQKPKVVFTMFESPELESSVRQLGGSMVDTVDASTILVTEHVKRTQKLLMAVGQGKPICSPEWIRKCKKAGEFLDPWDHILVDKEAEKKWNFSLKESLMRGQRRKLLEDYNVLLTVNNAVDVLKGAVEACGGKCFTKTPPKNLSGQLVVVSVAENKSKYSKYLKQNPKPIIVAPEAIFDGVLRQELHFEDHLLA